MDSKSLMDFLKSDGGKAVLSGVFGMLSSKGQSNQMDKQSAQNQQMSRDQLMQLDRQSGMNDRLSRDTELANQAPTGWEQQYLQQQLMKNLGLQKLLQPKERWHPNEKVMERMNSMPKAPQLAVPEDWQSVNPFGTGLSMEALAGRQGTLDLLSGGRGAGIDFSRMGLSPEEAARLNQRTGGYRAQVGSEYDRTTGPQQQNLQSAIQSPGGGGSRIGGAAKGAMTGASVGSIIPGVGTLLGGAIGGLGGLLFGGKKSQPQPIQQDYMQPQVQPRMQNPYAQGPWGQPSQSPMPQPGMGGQNPLMAATRRPRMATYGY